MNEKSNDESDYVEPDEMTWQISARKAVKHAATTVEKDEARGVIYMTVGEDQRFNPIPVEFKSWEDVMHALTQIGESEWINYVPFDGGEPVFEPDVSGAVQDAMLEHDVENFFGSIEPPDEGEEIITAHDTLQHRAGLIAQADLEEINAELIRHLALHPQEMYELDTRKFEKLVAELFRDKGYDIELGPGTKDGGVDVRAFMRSDIGTLLTLIQCKRLQPQNKINVDLIRGLYGVVNRDNASSGIIVTTSTFTRDARSEQGQFEHRIHLADYSDLVRWLKQYPLKGQASA